MAIVDVVSGAWYSDRSKIRQHTLAQVYTIFCSRGYVVFAARPGSKSRYTALEMDQNVKMAIRYSKEQSGRYKVDPNRLGLMGASAGGHLATLASLTPIAANPAGKTPLEKHDTSVRAVGVFFPPTDFIEWKEGVMIDRNVVAPLLFVDGGKGRTDEEILIAAKAASPLYQVKEPKCPFLLIHGDADEVVPLSQSQKLVDAIIKAGGSAELVVKKGGGHPWPTLPVEVSQMADWFDKHLNDNVVIKDK
ncbi:MAG: alpha/beta hydrolase [Planctomycetes bacterium]|nr:alpha/beta hydrolase [Planctomycetota bacterium]